MFIYICVCGLCMVLSFMSCTKDITVDLPQPEQQLVVEGRIENGSPPFILLSRNASFFGQISPEELSRIQVHKASMYIVNRKDTIHLREWCLNDFLTLIDNQEAILFLQSIGFGNINKPSQLLNICFYSTPDLLSFFKTGQGHLVGDFGQQYDLYVSTKGGKKLSATTTISNPHMFDSLTYVVRSDKDTLASVWIHFQAPQRLDFYTRYWTKRNKEPFWALNRGSVFDNTATVGKYISFPVPRAQSPNQPPMNGGLPFGSYRTGDRVIVRRGIIDKATYDFWNSVENDSGDTPFGSPSVKISNINGGLGIWSGYAIYQDSIVIGK